MCDPICNSDSGRFLALMCESEAEGNAEFDREHESFVDAGGIVLVEKQTASDIDLSGIFRLSSEEIQKALEEVAA